MKVRFLAVMLGVLTPVGAMAVSFSDEELAAAYASFDMDGDGRLTLDEFAESSNSVGEDRDNLEVAFEAFDMDRNEALDLVEFSALIEIGSSGSEEAELSATFTFMDVDKDGQISASELKRAIEQVGEQTSAADIAAGIKAADRNGDEMISFEEFVAASWGANQRLLSPRARCGHEMPLRRHGVL